MKIPINEEAPVISKGQIGINAPISIVWNILTSIDNWPKWQHDVTEVKINDQILEGTNFVWKAGGLTFNSQIHTMVFLEEFGWTGKTFGANAIHNWTFSEKDGSTVIHVEESLQGVLPSIFKRYFQKNLNSGIIQNLNELKRASE